LRTGTAQGDGTLRLAAATEEAIDAGIDCVEHGYFLTPEVLRKMKAKGVWLVPRSWSRRRARWVLQKDRLAGLVSRAGRVCRKAHWAMLQTAIKEGVRIAEGPIRCRTSRTTGRSQPCGKHSTTWKRG